MSFFTYGLRPLAHSPAFSAPWGCGSHTFLLGSRQDRLRSCEDRQNLAAWYHKFPLAASSFARFGDCRLLRSQLLVLFHGQPCGHPAPPYYRRISRFFPYSRAHFCFISKSPELKLGTVPIHLPDREVHVRASVPFGYGPLIATLLVFRTCSINQGSPFGCHLKKNGHSCACA